MRIEFGALMNIKYRIQTDRNHEKYCSSRVEYIYIIRIESMQFLQVFSSLFFIVAPLRLHSHCFGFVLNPYLECNPLP